MWFEVQGDMTHPLILLAFPMLYQRITPGAQHASRLNGMVRIAIQIKQRAVAVGFVHLVATDGTPALDHLGNQRRVGGVGKNPVSVLTDPFQRLTRVADDKGGQARADGFGDQVNFTVQLAIKTRRMLCPMALRGCADDAQCITEAVGTVVKIQPESRVFDRPVTGGQPQNESPAQQLVHARGLLGNNQWIAQRQDDTRRANRNSRGHGSQVACINQWIEDLADVPKVGVIERHIAQPDRGKSGFVYALSHLRVILQGGARAVGVAFQRGNETEGQMPRFEYAGIARVLLKLLGDCARARLRGHRGTLVLADGGDVEGEKHSIKSRWRGL